MENDLASQCQISSPRAVHFDFSTVLTDECFLEVILSIYRYKTVNFLFENGTFESKTLQQYGHVTKEDFQFHREITGT